MNYLPFDLETALKHPERVVTRDGRKVHELHLFETIKGRYPLIVNIGNDGIGNYTIDGKRVFGIQYSLDLFLLPEVKECWVNVYDIGKTNNLYTLQFTTEDNAKIHSKDDDSLTYIKTIRITNEPE